MEYETEEDGALFDASTNPSLDHSERKSAPAPRSKAKIKPQKAEKIPEQTEPA